MTPCYVLAACRPLHIAVAKGTIAAVDSIIAIMLSLGASLDYCNNLQQVSRNISTSGTDLISLATHLVLVLVGTTVFKTAKGSVVPNQIRMIRFN